MAVKLETAHLCFPGERHSNNQQSQFFLSDTEQYHRDTPDTIAGDKLRYIRLIAQQSKIWHDCQTLLKK